QRNANAAVPNKAKTGHRQVRAKSRQGQSKAKTRHKQGQSTSTSVRSSQAGGRGGRGFLEGDRDRPPAGGEVVRATGSDKFEPAVATTREASRSQAITGCGLRLVHGRI